MYAYTASSTSKYHNTHASEIPTDIIASFAHREPDALLQLNTIENLSSKKVFSAAEEFYKSSAIFMKVIPKVILQAGSTQGLFSWMLKDK